MGPGEHFLDQQAADKLAADRIAVLTGAVAGDQSRNKIDPEAVRHPNPHKAPEDMEPDSLGRVICDGNGVRIKPGDERYSWPGAATVAEHKEFVEKNGERAIQEYLEKRLSNFYRTGDPNRAAATPKSPQILWKDKARGIRLEPTGETQIRSADQALAVESAVKARFGEFKSHAILMAAIFITSVFGGVPIGMAIHEAKTITKEVEKIVKVPVETIRYVDRPAKTFVATCPRDGVRFWVNPANTGDVAPAANKAQAK